MNETKEEIRRFILAEFLPGESPDNLRDDAALLTSGILDSLAVLRLVAFVEQRFHIEIEPHETGVQYFDRIEDIVALVHRKSSAKE